MMLLMMLMLLSLQVCNDSNIRNGNVAGLHSRLNVCFNFLVALVVYSNVAAVAVTVAVAIEFESWR